MRCPNCFNVINSVADTCPQCGGKLNLFQSENYFLPNNTILLGRYVLGKVLGYGGFGIVYKAWDERLQRIVAVKEYFPTIYLNRDAGQREVRIFNEKNKAVFEYGKEEFLEEARNIAKYNTHPNIVHIYDYFKENGTAYFVMEYLDGKTLRDYIELAKSGGNVIAAESALHITMEVLKALMATHADGIIHRDVKPNNIVVLNNGTVKLFDFGSARLSSDESEMTRTVMITPGYAPPEQYMKKSKQGPYTDIYAVGAILYEMMTGVRPEESVTRKLNDTLEPPSSINGKVSTELDNAVMRAMALRAEMRFKTAEEFYRVLETRKNVGSVEGEIRRRKYIRYGIILLMILVIAAVAGYVGHRIYSGYRKAVLDDAEIDLWVAEMDGDPEHTREIYQQMSEEFLEKNPQITIDCTVIPEDEYTEQLANALADGEGPDLFVYPGQGVIDTSALADIGMVYDNENLHDTDYYLLGRYKQYLRNHGFLPLMIDMDVLYRNILKDGLPESRDYEEFSEGMANYIGTAMENTTIQNDMAGMYEMAPVEDEAVSGHYILSFSINEMSDEADKLASARLLYYFLSDNAQEYLSIEEEKGMPVNKNVWEVYMQINPNCSFLTDTVETVVFE